MWPSETLDISPVRAEDIGDLARALEVLSADMGDTHRATADVLARACVGDAPACHGLLARDDSTVVGAALMSPIFSTTIGAAGVYVSDLWVADAARGQGLGRALLRAVAELAARKWQARFLKLTVYAENTSARAFYDRLGFGMAERDLTCLLKADAFNDLLGDPQ
ncbi:MAG: GNAT family N-acetyltransferase [Roseovarius sp.]|uniref:GNAT family N-acetyltransferase n=1 Tax=Roseovarius sp. TaxID=1486281 RepID=UPI0032EF0E99